MPNFSATSDPESSLHSSDGSSLHSSDGAGNGPLWVDLMNRFIHLESQIDFLERKNESSNAAYLKLEDELRRLRRVSAERDELKSNLEREVKTMEAKYERLKEKYDTLREGSECGERKLKKQVDESRIKCCQVDEFTDKLKEKNNTLLGMATKNESLENENSEMKKKIENLERKNSRMMKNNEILKRQNKKIQEVSVEVEKLVEEWEDHTGSETAKGKTSGCNVHDKGTENSKCSGPKSTGISTLIDPKQENMVADTVHETGQPGSTEDDGLWETPKPRSSARMRKPPAKLRG